MTQRAIVGPYVYFVTTNTTSWRWVFDSKEKSHWLATIIHNACREYEFTIFGFCILPNHFHLLVYKRSQKTLSVLMKAIKGRFSYSMRSGRLWKPRFNFRIITGESYLDAVIRYIKYNYKKMHLDDSYGQPPYVYIDHKNIMNFFNSTPRV